MSAKDVTLPNPFEGKEHKKKSKDKERKFIGQGLKPEGPNKTVLNVLRVLIEDTANVVYIPEGSYVQSTVAKKDPRVLDNPFGRIVTVASYVSHRHRFNFSARCKKTEKIVVNNARVADRQVWRTYNFILDGKLHIAQVKANLSFTSFIKLQEAGVIEAKEEYSQSRAYTLNLEGMREVSPAWANPTVLKFVALLQEEAELEAEQTALGHRRKSIPLVPVADEDYSVEESAEVLEPCSDAVPTAYMVDCCEIRLMKYKPEAYEYSYMNYNQVMTRLQEVKHRLQVVRFMTRAITFAMERVGSKLILWDSGKMVQRGKYEKLEQTAFYQCAHLKRVTWQEECFR